MQSGREIAYLREIDLQCSLIARAASRLDRESEAALRDEVEIWLLVQVILTSAASLAAMLWSDGDERRWLRRALDIDDSSPLREQRSQLRPFAARVEEWEATRIEKGFVGFEGRRLGDPDDAHDGVECFQRFDATTGIVSLWDREIDLSHVVREVHRMRPPARTRDTT